MRRVVVTGLGAITPLGVGIRRTWARLLAGDTGIRSVADREPRQRWTELTSTVAATVPVGEQDGDWRPGDWLSTADQRRMSTFTQYAIAAADMALEDAAWQAKNPSDQEVTGVCLGSGIGNLHEMYETSLAHSQGVRPDAGRILSRDCQLNFTRQGLQEGFPPVRAQDPAEHGSGPYRHETWLARAEPRRYHSLHDGRSLHRGCLPLHRTR